MKNHTNHGAPVPLHLRVKAPDFTSQVSKSVSHEEQKNILSRAGTPPTRWGAFNGAKAATQPGIPAEMNPPLILKAVRDPAEAGGVHIGDRTARKRDDHGKFAPTQQAGPQTTAEDDLARQTREARLAEKRYLKALGVPEVPMGQQQEQPQLAKPKPTPMQQSGVPGAVPGQSQSTGMMNAAANTGMEQPMGTTPDGMPVYADPYNPAHANFTPDQHKAAAELHNRQAEMLTSSGRIPQALDSQLKARIHTDLSNESSSPMMRMMAQQGMPGNAQGQPNPMGGGNPSGGSATALDDFLTQLPNKDPGMKNMSPDQNKPLMNGPQDNAGPKPRMMDTRTGSPVGPQSQSQQFAGTMSQPQAMPPEPPAGNGSMPDISGPQAPVPGQMPMSPFDWNPEDFDEEEGGSHGASTAPASHAGAVTEEGPDEGIKPTAESPSSPPTKGAGPSTDDRSPATKREDIAPFGGDAKDEKAKEEQGFKSLMDWLSV